MKRGGRHHASKKHPLSSTIVCGQCGHYYGSKTWHSNSKYRQVIWRCNAKYEKHTGCTTPHLNEAQIQEAFNTLLGKIINEREVHRQVDKLVSTQLDTTSLEEEVADALEALNKAQTDFLDLAHRNARAKIDAEEYREQSLRMEANYQQSLEKYNELAGQLDELRVRKVRFEYYLKERNKLTTTDRFTPMLWRTLVDHLTVTPEGGFIFTLQDSTEVKI
ncbi:recombinase zinc beta ribbon domain-containing protein [Rothia sp. ZJ1223]|uniref:zinc ribbon domain-containing protein n=1 Tax=Rothia sp. ZJ1223 TaxID=2811098 RepID=UPI00351C3188